MTDKQVAAARKVMNQFPGLRIIKAGDVLTPEKGGTAGASVEVTDTMQTFELERLLRASCQALNG